MCQLLHSYWPKTPKCGLNTCRYTMDVIYMVARRLPLPNIVSHWLKITFLMWSTSVSPLLLLVPFQNFLFSKHLYSLSGSLTINSVSRKSYYHIHHRSWRRMGLKLLLVHSTFEGNELFLKNKRKMACYQTRALLKEWTIRQIVFRLRGVHNGKKRPMLCNYNFDRFHHYISDSPCPIDKVHFTSYKSISITVSWCTCNEYFFSDFRYYQVF